MKKIKEEIQETFNSIEDMASAQAPQDLYDRVLQQVEQRKKIKPNIFPIQYILRAAAVLAAITIMNAITLVSTPQKNFATAPHQSPSAAQALEITYFQNQSLHF